MTKKRPLKIALSVYACMLLISSLFVPQAAFAQFLPEPGSVVPPNSTDTGFYRPPKCTSGFGHLDPATRKTKGSYCPDIPGTDPQAQDTEGQSTPYIRDSACTYEEWLDNPGLHFWVEDPEVTELGKSGERSRQFLLWALTRQSIDDHPVILDVWQLSQNVALFLVLLVVIVMGIGIIIGQRGVGVMGSSFSLNVDITPLIIRIAILLLYIIFSARIVLLLIQLSDVMMEFFIRTLGVRDLFNIFFIDSAGDVKSVGDNLAKSEQAYREFIGCTNWNITMQESVNTSKALVKFTNMTYYFIGGMFLLRKIVLWFLLVVSPFLAILAPFVFIRNIGWIWIGVFFQWVFYGPLMALFLGTLANIWNTAPVHIPYIFDFSRVHKYGEVVYPTSINILYGGPAQKLGLFNTSNYVDTFAEYIISLMMLWTVLILPWWLLRIFRDYCCDGIYAMKNVLLAMYDQMRGGPGPKPGPGPTPTPAPTGTGRTALEINTPQKIPVEATIQLETPQQIKQAQTQQIVQSISMEARSLTDIAQKEINTVDRERVTQTLDKIQNPFKAETPSERQKLMNLRNEVQTRARQGDKTAQRLAAVTARSSSQERVAKEQLLSSMPKVEVPQTVAEVTTSKVRVEVPVAKKKTVVQNVMNNITNNEQVMQQVSQDTGVPVQQSMNIMQTMTRLSALDTSTDDTVTQIAQEVGVEEERVKKVIARTAVILRDRSDLVENVARQENVDRETVTQAVQTELRGAVGVTSEATDKIVQRVFTQVSIDNSAVQSIAQQSNMPAAVVQKVLTEMSQADHVTMSDKDIVMQVAEKTQTEHEKIKMVLQTTALVVGEQGQLTAKIAEEENIDEDTVEEVAQEEIEEMSKADKEIEDYVPQTQKVSIEDYEEVKSMWLEHYENGEIPVTENVQSREEWVEQDVVRISNILNKLMSPNRQMQEQGLTEVGYILPIFMVNNLSGEELLVYLKAKIQAAKQVGRDLEKEEAIRAKIEAEQEDDFVEVDARQEKQQAKEKTRTLKAELPIKEDTSEEQSGGTAGQRTESSGGQQGGLSGDTDGQASEGREGGMKASESLSGDEAQISQGGSQSNESPTDSAVEEMKKKLEGEMK